MKHTRDKGIDDLQEVLQRSTFRPVEMRRPPADESVTENYRRSVRDYLLTGSRTGYSPNINCTPVLLSPFISEKQESAWSSMVYNLLDRQLTNVRDILQVKFKQAFGEDETVQLHGQFGEIERLISFNDEKDLYSAVENAIKTLLEKSDDAEEHRGSCEVLQEQFVRGNARVLRDPRMTAFELLQLELFRIRENQVQFLELLKNRAGGLKDLLLLKRKQGGGSEVDKHFGFASEMIAFDEVEQISPDKPGDMISGERSARIEDCLGVLEAGIEALSKLNITLFTSKALLAEFALEDVFQSYDIVSSEASPCINAHRRVSKVLKNFVRIAKALKVAELEIAHEYDEDLHDGYFKAFSLAHLGDDELRFISPVIVIDESEAITSNPGPFINLISGRYPVKILALNRLHGPAADREIHAELKSRELASLAIFRRSAYVFQGAADTPQLLHSAIKEGLLTTVPALWNVLILPDNVQGFGASLAILRSAIDSRAFPRMEFNLNAGEVFGSHFNIGNNAQAASDFPVYSVAVETPSGVKEKEFQLTIADHIAALPDSRGALEIVPEEVALEELVPVAEYVSSEPGTQLGCIPFIWVTDENNRLVKAVVPISWIQYYRSCLDYWQFLQELGGAKSYYTEQVLEKEKDDWVTSKESELESLRTQMASEFEQSRKQDLGNAITRMLTALADPGMDFRTTEDVLDGMVTEGGKTIAGSPPHNASPKEEDAAAEVEAADSVSREVWIESEFCTSCNDCIDLLPTVFKYNKDKQAFVHNASGGSYAKIVAAAEKCPARCIHPGLPQNPEEAGLEKLLKRAEKFN